MVLVMILFFFLMAMIKHYDEVHKNLNLPPIAQSVIQLVHDDSKKHSNVI